VKIHVHIERLILEDLPVGHAQGPHIGAAIEKELTRLLVTGGLRRELRGGVAVPRLRAGVLQVTREASAPRIGQGIARAIHEGIGTPATGRIKP
jgi:hypothetical protein